MNPTSFTGVMGMVDADHLTNEQLVILAQRSNLQSRQTETLERPKAVCARLSICRRSLTNLVTRGALTPIRLPGCTRAIGFRRSDVDSLLLGNGGAA